MLNRIQTSESNNKTIKLPARTVTPLTGPTVNPNNDDKLRELRRPRSRTYIKNLIELQELLLELDLLRREQTAISYDHYEDNNQEQVACRSAANENNPPDDKENVGYEEVQRFEGDNQKDKENQGLEGNTWSLEESITNRKENKFEITKEERENQAFEVSSQQNNNHELTHNPIIDDLEKRIQEKLEQLGKENTRINELLTFIYRSDMENYLMECGVISRPGTPIYRREDMAVNEEDPKLAEHLKRGYDLYFDYADRSDFLTLEIYIDAYCVIYKDGIVNTII
ncbi:MAG: hypothetical protein K0S47_1948 [Herbinix sp.]|nr:hypothetical protein [Herbinix sp.]